MSATPVLGLGCAFSDRIEALLDGRVTVEGFALDVRLRRPQTLFSEVLRERAHDVAEMSLGSHVANVAAGRDDYVGLPVFLSRAFRHANIYVRADRVATPGDLAGKTIGVIDYQQTASVWARGLLADDHGVTRDSLSWITGGLHAPMAQGRAPPPPGVRVTRTIETLDALLARGDLDAVISPFAPHSFLNGAPHIRRLFADPRAEESAYYHRTGVFPPMHCVVVRRSLIEAHPQLAHALVAAFEAARRLALEDLDARDYPKIATAWLTDDRRATLRELGGEPWTYGLAQNAAAIETFLRYAHDDQLTDRRLTAGEVFPLG